MANLTFRTILATGSRSLGEGEGNGDAFDVFLPPKSLSNLENRPGLLLFMTRQVNVGKNFITINAPAQVSGQSYEEAKEEDYFAERIVENPSDTWILQIARVRSDALSDTITVGFHSRNEDGEPGGNRDNFDVARIFLLYFGSE